MPNSHVSGQRIYLRRIVCWAVCLAVALLAASTASAQDGDRLPAFGPDGLFSGPKLDDNEALSVTACFTLSDPKPSDPNAARDAQLFVTADISDGWHIYSITQGSGGPIATTITPAQSNSYKLTGSFVTPALPRKETVAAFGGIVVETHYDKITWRAPLQIAAGVDPRTLQIKGSFRAQPCTKDSCLPPKSYPFTASFSEEAPAMAAASVFTPDKLKVAANEEIDNTSTIVILVMAFAGGFILNLMPCVLPVIGLKLLSFVEQSGQSRSRAFMLNFWYALGLMSVFMVLATLALGLGKSLGVGQGWGALFQNSGFTITLAAVVFVMALSFFDVWEIPIPGFAIHGKTTDWSQREGAGGAFAKGVLTTFLATPCSAPLLAPALTWATTRSPLEVYMLFFLIGLGMAFPYLLIGAFPRLIRFMPKPGAWMETFKHIMGFVLLGTVVYLFTTLYPAHVVPAIALMFGLWGACWWVGRTPHATNGHARIRRWLQAAIFVAIIIIIAYPGIDEIAPEPINFGGIYDVMNYRLEKLVDKRLAKAGVEPVKVTSREELVWIPFTLKGLERRLAAGQTVLVDFTADWCVNCKFLEATVLDTQSTRDKLVEHNIATMQADITYKDPELEKFQKNLASEQVPIIAIFPADRPNEPIVLLGSKYSSGRLFAAIEEATAAKK